jgi:hypothetical protein
MLRPEADRGSPGIMTYREVQALSLITTTARQWPVLLPRKNTAAAADVATQERKDIVAAIKESRASIAINPKLKKIAQKGTEIPGGYFYGGQKEKDPEPVFAAVDTKTDQVNRAIWAELSAKEGGASSVNTYDRVTLTLGSGFAALGLLPRVMEIFLKSDAEANEMLLDAGFTLLNGKEWLAVDLSDGSVLAGNPALQSIRWETTVLSQFIAIAEDPLHGQNFVNAEWQALLGYSAAVPKAVIDSWPTQTIVYVAHCVHWGGLLWKQWASIGSDLKTIIRTQAKRVPRIEPGNWDGGGALQVKPVATATFITMADGLGKTVLEKPAPLPADISADKTSYAGHIFLDASSSGGVGKFWHLATG